MVTGPLLLVFIAIWFFFSSLIKLLLIYYRMVIVALLYLLLGRMSPLMRTFSQSILICYQGICFYLFFIVNPHMLSRNMHLFVLYSSGGLLLPCEKDASIFYLIETVILLLFFFFFQQLASLFFFY